MINRGKVKLFLPSVLTVVGVLLAWSIVQNLGSGYDESRAAPGASAPVLPAALPSVDTYSMPPFEDFAEIIERPIFSATRRPGEETELVIDDGPSDLELTVQGIIISNDERIAIVTPAGASGPARLSEGDRIQGWTVATIAPDMVTFRRDGQERQLGLSFDQPPPQPVPRATRRDRRLTGNELRNRLQGADRRRGSQQNEDGEEVQGGSQ